MGKIMSSMLDTGQAQASLSNLEQMEVFMKAEQLNPLHSPSSTSNLPADGQSPSKHHSEEPCNMKKEETSEGDEIADNILAVDRSPPQELSSSIASPDSEGLPQTENKQSYTNDKATEATIVDDTRLPVDLHLEETFNTSSAELTGVKTEGNLSREEAQRVRRESVDFIRQRTFQRELVVLERQLSAKQDRPSAMQPQQPDGIENQESVETGTETIKSTDTSVASWKKKKKNKNKKKNRNKSISQTSEGPSEQKNPFISDETKQDIVDKSLSLSFNNNVQSLSLARSLSNASELYPSTENNDNISVQGLSRTDTSDSQTDDVISDDFNASEATVFQLEGDEDTATQDCQTKSMMQRSPSQDTTLIPKGEEESAAPETSQNSDNNDIPSARVEGTCSQLEPTSSNDAGVSKSEHRNGNGPESQNIDTVREHNDILVPTDNLSLADQVEQHEDQLGERQDAAATTTTASGSASCDDQPVNGNVLNIGTGEASENKTTSKSASYNVTQSKPSSAVRFPPQDTSFMSKLSKKNKRKTKKSTNPPSTPRQVSHRGQLHSNANRDQLYPIHEAQHRISPFENGYERSYEPSMASSSNHDVDTIASDNYGSPVSQQYTEAELAPFPPGDPRNAVSACLLNPYAMFYPRTAIPLQQVAPEHAHPTSNVSYTAATHTTDQPSRVQYPRRDILNPVRPLDGPLPDPNGPTEYCNRPWVRPEGFWYHLDTVAFECDKAGCEKKCNLWDGVAVICPGCGPYSTVRYCGKQHLFEDVKSHWLRCRQSTFTHPCKDSTIPKSVRNSAPMLPNICAWDSPERHRQAVHFAMDRTGDYFIFADWEEYLAAGMPRNTVAVRCSTRVLCTVSFEEGDMKDRVRRLLGACLVACPEVFWLAQYMYQMLRDHLRSTGKWSEELSQALKYQMQYEFSVLLYPDAVGNRHACEAEWLGLGYRHCRDAVCRAEYSPLLGTTVGRMGHRQTLETLEQSYWLLRAARATHPSVAQVPARVRGEGFEGVELEDRRLFRRGEGWDGMGTGEMEIEGVNC
ncbi:hypothetical protein ASPZODRAFT_164971 [Penicilliopsis zonata CBS 506.65]|uniref:Uncharacterized protein n=1 Tax=Penicilliopsis zonata CBS 506.65 TaxID=1073090 RepID=A0A1L9SQU0_9EURO|nr:hypothetical protein ASPZODRAFT_164971 [Penicilliopsis zonata CBS 506.65]OJJ49464.1 hypothetical protein ASPZODRAFT_164971 [Penicilliopsis zonata CBS 506.65]